MFLEMNSLCNDVAFHGLFLESEKLSNLVVILLALHLATNQVTSCAHCVHDLWFEQVVVGVKLKALVE